nr:MAG TPA: hypothetical protein [Bacteriophage sp.]
MHFHWKFNIGILEVISYEVASFYVGIKGGGR